MIVIGASGPLPGIGVVRPGNIQASQLVVALSSPPRTLWIGIEITTTMSWWRSRTDRLPALARNTNMLVNVDHVRVANVVIRSQALPTCPIAARNDPQRIATDNRIGPVTTGA